MIAGSPYQKFLDLRKNCGIFVYESFDCEAAREGVAVRFRFRAGKDFVFQPRLFFHLPGQSAAKMADPAIQSLAFHIGMVEMISYWKAFCSPIIHIEPFLLQSSQQLWWKKLFRLGLAEFFHTNGIPQPGDDIFDFSFGPAAAPLPGPAAEPAAASPGPAAGPAAELPEPTVGPAAASPGPMAGSDATSAGPSASTATPASSGGIMLPVGGGKDSVVTLETLVRHGFPVRAMVINQRGATREVLKAAGLSGESVLEIDRSIDPLLLELNARGYLNGHTPFSAMLAFVSTMAARLAGDRYIVLSNESSASEATIPGTTINHQYSKSLEFESDFRAYARSYLGAVPEYFSYLRPLNELQIAALFSRMTNYHAGFKSCNAGSKTDTWCRKCSKCLFTYIMLAPFLESRQLMEIFGGDLFSDRELTGLLDQLTGMSDSKPFDCVGTITEVNAALAFMVRQSEKQGHSLPPLLQHYQEGGANSQQPTPNNQKPTPNPQHPTPNNQKPTTNTQHPTPNTQKPTANPQPPTPKVQYSGAHGHDEGELAFRRLLDDFATPHHLPEGFEQVLRRQVGTLKYQDRT